MTKASSVAYIRIPLPPREVRSLDQRIHAADEAWRDFIAVWNVCGNKGNGQSYLTLTAFARFLHELLPDPSLCAPLVHDFEARQQHAGGHAAEAHQ
jgi:hypothetical protein